MNEYDLELIEEVTRLAEKLPHVEYFIISFDDTCELEMPMQMDDATGAFFYPVAGFKVIPSPDCEPGEIGACFLDNPEINVAFVGQS